MAYLKVMIFLKSRREYAHQRGIFITLDCAIFWPASSASASSVQGFIFACLAQLPVEAFRIVVSNMNELQTLDFFSQQSWPPAKKTVPYMGSGQSSDLLSPALYRKHTCDACLLSFKIKTKQNRKSSRLPSLSKQEITKQCAGFTNGRVKQWKYGSAQLKYWKLGLNLLTSLASL